MLTGARQGTLSGVRRLLAAAMARDLGAFVIPGPEIARAHGLDLEAAGLQKVSSPRHASVLVIVGDIPPALCDAAAVVYAQMMRPRALLFVGTNELAPLPSADIFVGLSQQELIEGVRHLRTVFSELAFRSEVIDFDAPVLQIRIEYVCPMHPEVIQNQPGSCPKCGMNLMPQETQTTVGTSHTSHQTTDAAENTPMTTGHDDHSQRDMASDAVVEYTCPMHPEVVQDEPGSCPKCGMFLEPKEAQAETANEHSHMSHEAAIEYTCPMHPEVVQSEPGSCPKCGMFLEPRNKADVVEHDYVNTDNNVADHVGMDHNGMDQSNMDHSAMSHDDMGFMSMIDVTKDLPRSTDGLPMEWINAPFGPYFPGLPGGLLLTFTLDGDTVADSEAHSLFANTGIFDQTPVGATRFVEQLTAMDPLTPIAYQLLASQALENAAGVEVAKEVIQARIGGLERERISSHLNWLASFGQQTGFDWLMQQAASLQLKVQQADLEQLSSLRPRVIAMIKRLQRTPLLKSRTVGIGRLTSASVLLGPVARACGIDNDARVTDTNFTALGFTAASRKEGDVFARLQIRLEEMLHSFTLIKAANAIALPTLENIGESSGEGEATVETARGKAHLKLTLEKGQVVAVQLETPSTLHINLIDELTEQQALTDALVAVGSIDLSPWSMQQ